MTELTHKQFTAGLRAIATWYDDHPDMDLPTPQLCVYGFAEPESPQLVGRVAGALRSFKKHYSDSFLKLQKDFGGVELAFVFMRDAVCHRRVVKTEILTTMVPDPEKVKAIPLVERTETRETVEWDCPPLRTNSP